MSVGGQASPSDKDQDPYVFALANGDRPADDCAVSWWTEWVMEFQASLTKKYDCTGPGDHRRLQLPSRKWQELWFSWDSKQESMVGEQCNVWSILELGFWAVDAVVDTVMKQADLWGGSSLLSKDIYLQESILSPQKKHKLKKRSLRVTWREEEKSGSHTLDAPPGCGSGYLASQLQDFVQIDAGRIAATSISSPHPWNYRTVEVFRFSLYVWQLLTRRSRRVCMSLLLCLTATRSDKNLRQLKRERWTAFGWFQACLRDVRNCFLVFLRSSTTESAYSCRICMMPYRNKQYQTE